MNKLLVSISIIIIVMSSCTPVTVPSPTIQPTLTPDPIGLTRGNPLPVGSVMKIDNLEIQILEAAEDVISLDPASNIDNRLLRDGEEFLRLQLTISCSLDPNKKCSVISNNFKLVGSRGVVYKRFDDGYIYEFDANQEFYGGATFSGYIYFLVRTDDTPFILEYTSPAGAVSYLTVIEK